MIMLLMRFILHVINEVHSSLFSLLLFFPCTGATVFEQFRNKLLGGALMTKHVKSGTPRVRHMYLKPDLRFLAWREPRGKSDKGQFDFSTVKVCEAWCFLQ